MNALNLDTSSQSVIPNRSGYARDLPFAERDAILKGLDGLAGYSAVQTMLPEGTALYDVGERNLARVTEEVGALPNLRDFNDNFQKLEALKTHKDAPATLAGLRMLPDGKLQRLLPGGGVGAPVGMTPTGLNQLVSLHRDALDLPSNFAGAIQWGLEGTATDKADTAQMFNQLTRRAAMSKNPALDVPRVFRLARRVDTLEPYIYSVTSLKHVGIAGGFAAMVQRLTQAVGHMDARVRVTSQGHDRLDVEVIFPMLNREIRVGDVLWGSITLTLSEAKDVSAGVADGLMRVLCANLTRAFYGKDTGFTRKHIGADNFVEDIMGRIAGGAKRLEPFIRAFGESYTDKLTKPRPEMVEAVFKQFPKELSALSIESVLNVWDADGTRSAGNTRAGLVNAVTRASKTLGVTDAALVEQVAGRITFEGWGA